jgi:precorrin-8X/cobalt-precorrin-8 methylmutase
LTLQPPPRRYDYETDGAAIYERSFATIRAESDLGALPADAERVAVRMVHACGQTDLTRDLIVHPDLVTAARGALGAGAPILTDAHMVASGVTRARLPADNEVLCLLRDPRVPDLATAWGTTRSAAAVSLWVDRLEGAVVAIGNAPTALFHLLELLDAGAPLPAAIIGVPVGFVGAAESKEALVEHHLGVPYLVVRGRRGGSALAASAVNALAQGEE